MTTMIPAVLASVRSAWRRDGSVLWPLAGVTMVLPQLAVLLLVPAMPRPPEGGITAPDDPAALAWAAAVTDWGLSHGIWYVVAPIVGLFGALAAVALYCDARRPTLREGLARAGRLLPRYVLATVLVGVAALGVLLPGAASRVMIAVLVPVAFYLLGRTMLAGPVIVAEAPVGAVAALSRSWALTRRRGWPCAALYAGTLLLAQVAAALPLAIGGAGGGLLTAIGALLAATVAGAAAMTLVLIEVALYRVLAASRGT